MYTKEPTRCVIWGTDFSDLKVLYSVHHKEQSLCFYLYLYSMPKP